MFCPQCGELAPPGPLDVRECAPRPNTRSRVSLTMLVRLMKRLPDLWRRIQNPSHATVNLSPPAREHSARAFVSLQVKSHRRDRGNSDA